MSKQRWYTATEPHTAKTIKVRGALRGGMIEKWTAVVKKAANGLTVWETRQGNAGYVDNEQQGIEAAMAALGLRTGKES